MNFDQFYHPVLLVHYNCISVGRKQGVSVLDHELEPSSLLYSLPQGSVLSPIFFILYMAPLSDITEQHSVLHHMFADDTVLNDSTPCSSTDSLFCNMQNCISDVNKWTFHNKLQLNKDKTEKLAKVLFCP